MRDKKGRFTKGHKLSKENIKAIIIAAHKRKKDKIKLICKNCKKEFEVYPYRKNTATFCSRSCRSVWTVKQRRKNITPILHCGYMFIKMPSYHRSNKQNYAKIADLVLEKKLGRKLKKDEIAHHVDGCKTNDSPDNLEVMTSYEHNKIHIIEAGKNTRFKKKS